MTKMIWRVVTINGHKWAYRRYWGSGSWDQVTADTKTIQYFWHGDIMQYYDPITR